MRDPEGNGDAHGREKPTRTRVGSRPLSPMRVSPMIVQLSPTSQTHGHIRHPLLIANTQSSDMATGAPALTPQIIDPEERDLLPAKWLPGSGGSRLIKPSQEAGISLAARPPLTARAAASPRGLCNGPQGGTWPSLSLPPPSLDPGMAPHLTVLKDPSWADGPLVWVPGWNSFRILRPGSAEIPKEFPFPDFRTLERLTAAPEVPPAAFCLSQG